MRATLDKHTVPLEYLKDVDITTTPPVDTNVLEYNATLKKWVPGAGSAGTGETNTATNLNTGGGIGVFDSKVGVELKFRGINAGSAQVTVTFNGITGEIEIDLGTVGIDALSDVDTSTTAPVLDDILQFNGSTWVPTAFPATGAIQINDLTDVDTATTPPAIGDGLIFDGTNWVTDLNQLTRRTDFDGPYVYEGEAQAGTADANPNWRITRTEFVGEDSITLFADGNTNFDNVWANRKTTVVYS